MLTNIRSPNFVHIKKLNGNFVRINQLDSFIHILISSTSGLTQSLSTSLTALDFTQSRSYHFHCEYQSGMSARVIQTNIDLLPRLQAAIAIEQNQEYDPTEGQAFLPYNQEPPQEGAILYTTSK